MITYTGIHVTPWFGAPSIRDIAVQSMRMVRWSGAGERWCPIGLHMMLVADLLPPELEAHALLHDAAEVAGIGDVNKPMKTQEGRELENTVLYRTYNFLGAPHLTVGQAEKVKQADFRAALAEGALKCGGPGFADTQNDFRHDRQAEDILLQYFSAFNVLDAINPNGQWAWRFEHRLRSALRRLQANISYAARKGAAVPAANPLLSSRLVPNPLLAALQHLEAA